METPSPPPRSRRDRQRRDIQNAVAAGELARATGLAQEHLVEFPEDEQLVQALLAPP